MLRSTGRSLARYQAYAAAYQSRFQWRHRDFDPWRRLMDASCFMVDWITRPRAATIGQFGGHWTHIVTCAHVLTPWDYPNFYPPVGHTRFVSKLTMSDCQGQLRIPSLEGEIVYRHFLSQHHNFVHSDRRLDLGVGHAEQFYRRSGESKLLWLQNEGFCIRPRLEVLEELQVGDIVWLHGMTARGDIFDEAEQADPLMVPTGVRARVKHLDADHFFLDTTEDPLHGNIEMGMCGSPVLKDGKCFGMLTSTVHPECDNKELAGTAMCTYSRDIRKFLIEVEKQMKNPPYRLEPEETIFQGRRRDESVGKDAKGKVFKDWEADNTRLAHHIQVSMAKWQQSQNWTTEEDKFNRHIYGRNGAFSSEDQETAFGLNMTQSSQDGGDVQGQSNRNSDGERISESGYREDPSPFNHHVKDAEFVRMSEWDSEAGRFTRGSMKDAAGAEDVDKLRRSVESMNRQRENERLKKMTAETMQEFRREQANKDYSTTPDETRRKRHEQRKRPFDDGELDGLWGKH